MPQTIQTKLKLHWMGLAASLQAFLIALTLCCVAATAYAQDFARGYYSNDTGLRSGMVVALSPDSTADKPLVERASLTNANKVVGVTSNTDEHLVTIASGDQQVYVLAGGVTTAYISDLNGLIKKGEAVVLSPIKGVLMRNDSKNPIIGTALEDFPETSSETQNIDTDNGSRDVKVSKLSISLDSGLAAKQDQHEQTSLQKIGKSVIGKDVGELQVIVALIIFLVVMVAEGAIIYGAITSGLTALGRNPLAKRIIKTELFRVLGLAVIVLIVGLGAIYAVLSI